MEKTAGAWYFYTKENILDLIAKAPNLPTQAQMAHWAGWSESGISRAIGKIRDNPNEWQVFQKAYYDRLIPHIIDRLAEDHRIASSNVEYMGLARFHDINATDVAAAIRNICGTFISYRYSHRLAHLSMVLRGLTEITASERKDAISVRSFYRIQALDGVTENEVTFERRGYFLPKHAAGFILSKKLNGDKETITLNSSIIYGSGDNSTRILSMKGIISDWESDKFYATSIFLERTATQSIEKDIKETGYAKAFKVTDAEVTNVLAQLDRPWIVTDNRLLVHL